MVNELTLAVFGRRNLNKMMPLKEVLQMLQDQDLINVGELAEKAVSKKTGVEQTARCQEGCDLVNGWEIKHAQTHLNSRGSQRKAYIAGMHNKTELLRVIVTERLTGKLYYFKVPFRAYAEYRTSSLNWCFDNKGNPQRTPLRATYRPNYWDFEVESFDELCR
jgi:hypothetical protein